MMMMREFDEMTKEQIQKCTFIHYVITEIIIIKKLYERNEVNEEKKMNIINE